MRFGQQPEVRQVARDLGLPWEKATVPDIVAFCVERIRTWLADRPHVRTIGQVQQVVCERLGLVFEEIWSDDDLRRVRQKYIDLKEITFAALPSELDDTTYAALFELKHADQAVYGRYVAVIDCRGAKAARRFFTRWHEIAHLLVLRRALEVPCHRSTEERDPIERLMDTIAGEIGFYDPLFRPVLESRVQTDRALTFEGVESVRSTFCPEASFQATLIACLARTSLPLIYVEAGLGYKKAEQEQLDSAQMTLFPVDPPQRKLRALVAQTNEWARESGLRIDRNMEVPAGSIIARLSEGAAEADGTVVVTARERLGDWRHSDGTSLRNVEVRVEARRVNDRVLALIAPFPDYRDR